MAKLDAHVAAQAEEEIEPIAYVVEEDVAITPCERRLAITIPRAEVEATYEKLLHEVCREAQLPGFRKGKVPRPLLEQRVGARLRQETRENCAERAVRLALLERELIPLGEPREPEMEPETSDSPLRVTVSFEHDPIFKLGDYRNISIEVPVRPVQTADVDQRLEVLRRRASQLVPITDRGAQVGDVATVSMTASIDLQPWQPGCRESYTVEIGQGDHWPGFEEAFVGMLCGSTFVIECTVPEEDSREELRGRKVLFRVTLNELHERRIPELNEAFAVDYLGFESLEQLREDVRRQLETEAQEAAEEERTEKLLDALVAMHSFEPPPRTVAMFEQQLAAAQRRRLKHTGSPEAIEQAVQNIESAVRRHEEAVRHAKLRVLIRAIARAEKLSPSKEDILRVAASHAAALHVPPAQYLEAIKDSPIMQVHAEEALDNVVVKWLLAAQRHSSAAAAHEEDTSPAPAASNVSPDQTENV